MLIKKRISKKEFLTLSFGSMAFILMGGIGLITNMLPFFKSEKSDTSKSKNGYGDVPYGV